MPSLQDIREFNDSLVRLANEPEVISGWGEEVEALPEPDEGLDTDLSSLLADTGDLTGAGSIDDIADMTDVDIPGEMSEDLSDLLDEEVEPDIPAADDSPGPSFESVFESDEEDVSAADADIQPDADIPPDADFTPDADTPPDTDFPADEAAAAIGPESADDDVDFSDFAALLSDEPLPGPTDTAEPEPFGEIPGDESPFGAEPPADDAFTDESPFGDEAPVDLPADDTLADDPFGGEPQVDLPADDTLADDPFGGAADPFGELPDSGPEAGDLPADEPAGDSADPFGDEAPVDLPADDTLTDDPFGGAADPFGELPDSGPEAGDLPADEPAGDFADPFAELPGEAPDGTLTDDSPFGDAADIFGDQSDGDGSAGDEPGEGDFGGFDAPGSEIDDDDIFGIPQGGEELGTAEFPVDAPDADSGAEDIGDIGSFEFSDEDEDTPAPADDSFSFDEPAVPGDGAADSSDFGDISDDDDVSDLEELDTSGLDEFSLGDFGAEFGVIGDDGLPTEEDLNPASAVAELAAASSAVSTGEFQISESDFHSFQSTMSSLPLNLRLEIGAIVTEAKGTTDQVEELIRRLAAGESPIDIAAFASKILGRQIRIPRGYEKRTGLDFEAERQSFSYQFRENILPILRMVALFAVAAGVLGLAGYHLVFRPLHSRSLYREGLALIAEDQYTLGNQTFERAREVWASNKWFYSYAEAFISERQYTLAGEKYEQLLFGMPQDERDFYNSLLEAGQYPSVVTAREPEKQGILDYARLESEVLGNYGRADRLLQLILVEDIADYEGRLAIGDNYMRWADTDPARYEDARVAYARLMERFGQTDELLFRMLRYFVRTDNLAEVVVLKDLFQQNNRLTIEPDKYAEMAGYLIDNNLLDDVEEVLFRAVDADPLIPEIHYNLARYYRLINAAGEEELALRAARRLLSEANPKTARVRGMLVDTITRQGENFYDIELYLDAQQAFGEAIEEYEEGLRRRALAPDPIYGRAYSHLADILYYVGRQYDDALRYLNAAEENGYDEPNLDYKQGFILYRNDQLDSALGEFREAAEDPSGTTNALLWATANTYFRRQNFFAAEAYYRELLDRVELQRDNIQTLLVDEDPLHRSAIEYLIRVNNNLGVTLNKLSEGTGDPDYFSRALVYLTQSIEYSENYRRDPDTLARSSAVDLAYLNQRGVLYPTPEYELQIYNALAEDLDDPVF